MKTRLAFLFVGLSVAAGVAFFFGRLDQNNVQNETPTGAASPQVVKTLRVLSYSSLLQTWGPGPILKRMFEHNYRQAHPGAAVLIEYILADDAGFLLEKAKRFKPDVVMGLDQFSIQQALKVLSWRKLQNAPRDRFSHDFFQALDWAPIGFLYRDGEIVPPTSLDDLLSPRFAKKITLQDPRSSSPGFQFLSWVVLEKGNGSLTYLKKLKENVQQVSSSWSQSYGLFTRGLTSLTLGFATSPFYHMETESDARYRFAFFAKGHPIQVEYVGIRKECEQCELADQFLRFLISQPAQQVLMHKNWMLPLHEEVTVGTPFEHLSTAKDLKLLPFDEFNRIDRDRVIKIWEAVQF